MIEVIVVELLCSPFSSNVTIQIARLKESPVVQRRAVAEVQIRRERSTACNSQIQLTPQTRGRAPADQSQAEPSLHLPVVFALFSAPSAMTQPDRA